MLPNTPPSLIKTHVETINDDSLGPQSFSPIQPPAKVGTRLSRESVRILRNWFSAHQSRPFPSDSEKRSLQNQTGLTRTQILNWLANTRRRNKISASRTASPQSGQTNPVDIPRRPGTPAFGHHSSSMNPLERWVDSPPENEPASVSAIARAVASNSQAFDNISDPSHEFVPAGTVDSLFSSGGSLSSADSHASQSSLASFEVFKNARSRRKRRAFKRADDKASLLNLQKTFQCTFCTESFKRKYDWQRHENSVHMSLERWICTPHGPRARKSGKDDLLSCVFCGLVDPDDAHVATHNYPACENRALEERTFNRKDHLRQHLRLVHETSFSDWSMESWRISMPNVRSQCGFCGLRMETWDTRVHHLSEHFKLGKTIADWQGDWGFEPIILKIVENAMPPYLIEFERQSPYPFQGGKALVATPRSAYELLKIELAYFMQKFFDGNSRMPTMQDMQFEACRIILASESIAQEELPQTNSWVRDLILSDAQVVQNAKLGPMRSPLDTRLFPLQINGKKSLFEDCPSEQGLQEFVQAKISLGIAGQISDYELRQESCCIIGRMEEVSTSPSDFIATWLVRLIHSAGNWLPRFRQRASLPSADDVDNEEKSSVNATIHEYTRLESGMAKYLDNQRAMGIEPSDENLRQQARIIVGKGGEGWTQTALDDQDWLSSFKRRHLYRGSDALASLTTPGVPMHPLASEVMPWGDNDEFLLNARSLMKGVSGYALNDWNFYQWFEDELRRWAVATMSPRNPTQHIPTDEEFQHYGRMMAYNDDDPVNQTVADNLTWLGFLKTSLGIVKD
ncbi:hypothetical protein EDB80DRAFT_581081 [Ilyonectria destructans]|nr:hypothetical protein EDB80DRAFT_581081 [Ilyonectria destructans]